jgi:hypothetical protein
MYSYGLSEDTWNFFVQSHGWTGHMSVFLCVYIDFVMGRSVVKETLPNTLLTPWSKVRLEKLTGFQPVKKFPAFYGTRRFIKAFKSACHLSLS